MEQKEHIQENTGNTQEHIEFDPKTHDIFIGLNPTPRRTYGFIWVRKAWFVPAELLYPMVSWDHPPGYIPWLRE
jgi:hypothetical protein